MGEELNRMLERMKNMHGQFDILSVTTKQRVFIKLLVVTAKDIGSQFVVTANFDAGEVPSEARIIEGLKYELDVLLRKETIAKLQGRSIKY